MGYQDVDIAFHNALLPFATLIQLVFYILLFILVVKAIKYLNMKLKHDCSSFIYKQKCMKEQLAHMSFDDDKT